MRKLTYSDAANWDLYLPAALFAYCLRKHCVTEYSSFSMLYGQEATTLLLLGPPCLLWGSCSPVPKCVLDCSQGPSGRGCHSLGSKWAFIHSQKEDPLRYLLVYGPGGQGNNMDLPILGVLQQYLGLLILVLGLLHLSLGRLLLKLGLLLLKLGLWHLKLGLKRFKLGLWRRS
ncbi:hypothetical protein DSO57_1031499 [Entomophthora muscae]|uniref:Uncharacterized protein n=1 Tax=Entomophthora muscae TaxID=34485 RepID=A0ACC2SPR2_9FUNG|nr:hypothetical protein DSO57_1031499 [Entomophthora muscae]